MKWALVLALLIAAPNAIAAEVPGHVADPQKCVLQWETRLYEHRHLTGEDANYWPEQLILDAELGGDEKLAKDYMEQHGWFAAYSGEPTKTLYLMPNTERMGIFPAADPSQGVKHACTAAWISGVPFTQVVRRGEGGQGVIYEVSVK